jgi:hypothetical protein
MRREIIEILLAVIAIAMGMPRAWPRRPHQDW